MDTAGVISSVPSQSVGASCNVTTRPTFKQPKGVLTTQESSTYQQHDLQSFDQHSRGDMTTSQALNYLPSQDHPFAKEAAQQSLVESNASEQELKVKKVERSIQDQATFAQMAKIGEDILTKSGLVVQRFKEHEKEGKSFDSDEMDFKAPLHTLLRNCLDQTKENFALLKENTQARPECQSNVKDEDQTQEDLWLENADQKSKSRDQNEAIVILKDTPNPNNHYITYLECKRLELIKLRKLLKRLCFKREGLLALKRVAKLLYPP
ncbi:hypothetical protein DPX16_12596 [Anabarilius grahami]|uniref:Uncharacterized protein n=1 Tax=Anabarilius grahami TaxID=495550 RepID=A0A3N0YKL4_ANAGA|nr:hypothetical protein DPX16_12596 [Anabarilius grahami]